MEKRTLPRCVTQVFALLLLCASCFGADNEQARKGSLSEQISRLKAGESLTTSAGLTVKMIQKNAGVADKDGWYPARGADGAISVLFPGKFNEGVQTAKATDGALVTVHALGTATNEGMRLALNCFERSDSRISPDAVLGSVKDLEQQSVRFRRQPFFRGSINGLEFRGVYATGVDFAGQTFMTQRYLCQFIAEFPNTAWETIPPAVRKSLDSLRIQHQRAPEGATDPATSPSLHH